MSFSEYYLGDIAEFSQGIQVAIEQQYESKSNNMVRFLRIVDYTKESEPIRFINDPGSKYHVKEDDLVMIRYGSKTAGKVVKGYKGVIANNMFKISLDRTKIDKIFAYYLLANDKVYSELNASQSSSTMPAITFGLISKLKVNLPPLQEQKVIANILSSVDEKIELNNQINKTLEEMAQALFKRWFVDFEFPNEDGEPYKSSGGEMIESELGMIPKGWNLGKLSDLVNIKYGKDHKKLEDGNIPVFGSGGIMRYVDKSLYEKESVLIPRKGTLNNVMYVNKPFWSVDTMFFTEMKLSNIAKFVYQFLKAKDLASMNIGSAVPSMTTAILNTMDIVIPNQEILDKFNDVITAFYTQIQFNDNNSKNLVCIRDSLLPKLMSGEIRVEDIEANL